MNWLVDKINTQVITSSLDKRYTQYNLSPVDQVAQVSAQSAKVFNLKILQEQKTNNKHLLIG